MKKEYSSAQNFRTALLERIKKLASNDGKTIQRLQRQVAYDRGSYAVYFQERLFLGS